MCQTLGPLSSQGGGAAEARGLGSRERPEAAFLRHPPEASSREGLVPDVRSLCLYEVLRPNVNGAPHLLWFLSGDRGHCHVDFPLKQTRRGIKQV